MATDGREITLELPILVAPSNNVLLRMHWLKYRDLKKQILDEVFVAWHQQVPARERKMFENPIELEVQRYGMRLMDKDNLIGGLKPLIDCLQPSPKGIGVIQDDTLEWVTSIKTSQQRVIRRCQQKVIITLREV